MERHYQDTVVSFYYTKDTESDFDFFSFETTRPGLQFVRGIQIGDSFDSVIAKFPDEKNDIQTWDYYDTQTLYGWDVHLFNYGRILIERNGLKNIWYSDGWSIFKIEFDEKENVAKMILSPSDF